MALTPRIKLAAAAAVGVAALAMTTAAAVPSLAASGPAPTKSGGSYLALGDSIPFGYRESNAQVTPDYTNPKSMSGYPELVARDLGLNLTNAACPGETTASFIMKGNQDNGCTKTVSGTPGYRAAFPLHHDYPRSQLLYALGYLKAHPDTKLVTLQIGANDGLRCRALHGGTCQGSDLAAVIGQIQTNLNRILTKITTTGGYHGQIVLVNYYSINVIDPSGTGQVAALNQVEAGVAKQFSNVRIANAFTIFKNASKNTANGTPDTCQAGLETYLKANTSGNENCGIHPSLAGQGLLANAVARVVRKS
jgi:lysophospholipase L1-like esterase